MSKKDLVLRIDQSRNYVSGPVNTVYYLNDSNAFFAELSAITADMGTLNAGSIVIGDANKLWLNDDDDGGLAIGGEIKESAPFRVDEAGHVVMTSVDITAGNGVIINEDGIRVGGAGASALVINEIKEIVGGVPVGKGIHALRFYDVVGIPAISMLTQKDGTNSPLFRLGRTMDADWLQWDASGLALSGTITAKDGLIGGWTIALDNLYAGSGVSRVGMAPGSFPFYAGSETPELAVFSVNTVGKLKASDVEITAGNGAVLIDANGITIDANDENNSYLSLVTPRGYLKLRAADNIEEATTIATIEERAPGNSVLIIRASADRNTGYGGARRTANLALFAASNEADGSVTSATLTVDTLTINNSGIGDGVKIMAGLEVNRYGAGYPTGDWDTRIGGLTEPDLLVVEAGEDAVLIGGATDHVKFSKGGAITYIGAAKRKLTMRPALVAGKISGAGDIPTTVAVGVHAGYSLPIWSTPANQYEELYFRDHIAGRWDGASDITVTVKCALAAAETTGEDFRLQLAWEAVPDGGILTTNSRSVETQTELVDATQYAVYYVNFTIDWDIEAHDIAASDHLGLRVRRVAVTGVGADEVDGEIIILDCIITYTVDKVYKAP